MPAPLKVKLSDNEDSTLQELSVANYQHIVHK